MQQEPVHGQVEARGEELFEHSQILTFISPAGAAAGDRQVWG